MTQFICFILLYLFIFLILLIFLQMAEGGKSKVWEYFTKDHSGAVICVEGVGFKIY